MTQIVKEIPQPTNIITLSNHGPSTSLYYGVQVHPNEGGRGFIQTVGYETNRFRIISPTGLTRSNGWGGQVAEAHSIRGCIELLLNAGYEVYTFDTAAELFDWLLGRDEKSAESRKRK
jgi:hypothetical protein